MLERFPVAVIPVLGGLVAGTTVTVKRVLPPGATVVGLVEMLACSVLASHELNGLELFRGDGVPTIESELLLSVSLHPPPLRSKAVVAVNVAALAPSKQLAVEP